ncbi:MAG: outer membrane beta-barrel protein [Bacteroidetes bacterium]|nr:outer membrane beta-barrel protein [Bacteroidota bacterium]
MGRLKTGLTLVLIFFTMGLYSQTKDSVKVRLNHYTLTIGGGWTHYINNLENGDQDIQKDFAGVSFKFFWEPEYRLSLGLETGYYELFKVKYRVNPDTTARIDRTVIPLLLLVRMRIVDHVYLGAGMGLAIINTKVAGAGEKITTRTTSFANFEVSAAYIYPLSKHWLVGGEFKTFRFGGLNDWMYSLQATCTVKL